MSLFDPVTSLLNGGAKQGRVRRRDTLLVTTVTAPVTTQPTPYESQGTTTTARRHQRSWRHGAARDRVRRPRRHPTLGARAGRSEGTRDRRATMPTRVGSATPFRARFAQPFAATRLDERALPHLARALRCRPRHRSIANPRPCLAAPAGPIRSGQGRTPGRARPSQSAYLAARPAPRVAHHDAGVAGMWRVGWRGGGSTRASPVPGFRARVGDSQ